MCGRASLNATEQELENRFNASFHLEELERYRPIPNFNIAPTDYCPVLIKDSSIHFRIFRWGLLPNWAKSEKEASKMINIRTETIREKPAFRKFLKDKRCIVPLDGFYEWKAENNKKIPYRIIVKNHSIFAVAGLWSAWQHGSTLLETFTILTLPANSFMAQIHDRMPAILTPENESLWLDNSLSTDEYLQVLKTYPSDLMDMYRVSDRVNSVKNNDKDLIKRIVTSDNSPLHTSSPISRQLTIFD